MSRTSYALAALAALALTLTGCTSKADEPSTPPADLPAAQTLLLDGAKAMAEVKSAHFVIDVNGKISGLTLKRAEGDLTQQGSAQGSATIEQFGTAIEAKFVIVGSDLYLQGATGGYQKLPLAAAATVYDPSAILDPNRGVAKLLSSVKTATTQAKETVDGKETYKIQVEPDPVALAALIPGVGTGVTGHVWLDATSKQLVKGEFLIPAKGSDPAGTVTVTFTKYNDPVTISAP
ncbi:lipoarabinomannan carrier protein LprG [Catellatospora methionotrophica]|uniref:Lipoarabinomannan carrier protein LprG n=1 Tax=Catellatospora methionotrophica TaxID=121620 RepID=A0A8J3LC80_9ACTN|nr:LppX_LprAFG lipoprotein [Catellatospora methionotrophica]GIG16085.1 lipoarabinomannan carrier protein LprG [Catellatospora methionotrophica]